MCLAPCSPSSLSPCSRARWRPRALGVLACAGLFVALAWAFGYIVASAITLFVVMRYEGMPFDWRLVAISIGGAVFYWLMFVKFLGVEQPVGFVFGG
ncbi:MAG: hypothetical protein RL430_1399 [Actinomycetota bacterium]